MQLRNRVRKLHILIWKICQGTLLNEIKYILYTRPSSGERKKERGMEGESVFVFALHKETLEEC